MPDPAPPRPPSGGEPTHSPARGPAYRVCTPRLVVRCWEPADAPLLHDAVAASLAHLRPWMPWAGEEPKELDERVEVLRTFRGSFDLGIDFTYGIFDPAEAQVLGGTGLHPRTRERTLEIGYWIRADHTGRGLATEAAAALTRVAFEVHGVHRVEIRCDPLNVRSSAVPARLGFRKEAVLRADAQSPDGSPRDTVVWGLLADEFPGSHSACAPVEAFDAALRRIL